MKLLMHVLKKNDKLEIDNENISWKEIRMKLLEETAEVLSATEAYQHTNYTWNLKNIVRETFDVIQICILILWKAHRESKYREVGKLIEEINIEHKDKLHARGWEIKTGISIEIKE